MIWSLLIVAIWAALGIWAFWDVVRASVRRRRLRRIHRAARAVRLPAPRTPKESE